MANPIVLVSLDGSKSAAGVLPIAQRLADLSGVALEVVPGGRPKAILTAAADLGARLIVMQAHSRKTQRGGAIGATALAVLRGAGCPVVMVDPSRAQENWNLRRLLAPHDGSPAVSDALGPAIEFTHEARAELIVLQVAHDARALEAGSIAPPAYLDQVHHSWPAWSEEFLQRLASVCPLEDVRVRLLVGHGEPAAETFRVAAKEAVDLIVLAWKGRWEAPHASTFKAVLRNAPCPVMVTRVPGS
ncbi:MAG TPA: universal stress protein [Caulobacteraceae bacterium]|jgi:nucleotide-binding universal stress UspA family protein|nr:universal stress protein [Caulobacteraceae bacterium]